MFKLVTIKIALLFISLLPILEGCGRPEEVRAYQLPSETQPKSDSSAGKAEAGKADAGKAESGTSKPGQALQCSYHKLVMPSTDFGYAQSVRNVWSPVFIINTDTRHNSHSSSVDRNNSATAASKSCSTLDDIFGFGWLAENGVDFYYSRLELEYKFGRLNFDRPEQKFDQNSPKEVTLLAYQSRSKPKDPTEKIHIIEIPLEVRCEKPFETMMELNLYSKLTSLDNSRATCGENTRGNLVCAEHTKIRWGDECRFSANRARITLMDGRQATVSFSGVFGRKTIDGFSGKPYVLHIENAEVHP